MIRKSLICVGLALSLAGCAAPPAITPSASAAPSPSETLEPRPSRTHRPTRTPKPTRTATLSVASTPEPLQSVTPTVLTLTSPPPSATTPTPTGPLALDCQLIWQSPPNPAVYASERGFSVGWNLKNVGTTTWEPGSFEFVYLGGAKLYPGDRVPLASSVAPGDTVVLSLPMRAPKNPGMYTTHWGIRQGDIYFCRLTLTITVPF